MLKDYIDMIDYYFVNEYYVNRKPGQVLLIFVSRVNMAMYIRGFLKQKSLPFREIRKAFY